MAGMFEREDALAALDAAWEQADTGRVVVVCGPAGIGKTSLLAAFRDRLDATGARVFSAIGSEFEHGFAFGLARQMLERPLHDLDHGARDRILSGPAAAAGQILGLPGADGPSPVADPAFAAMHALHWAVGNLAAEDGPLALLVDDAHWTDPETAAWLAYSARRRGDLAVLIVVALRDDEAATTGALADLLNAPQVERLALEPLSEAAVGQLLMTALGPVDDELAAACAKATGGNAFLLSELIREIDSEGTSPTAAAVSRLAPPTIARAAVARMARLSGSAADVGTWLAVLGAATIADLCSLTALDDHTVRRAIDDLVGAGIVAPSKPLEFRHPVVRAAILGELAPMQRADAHRAAARVLHEAGRDAEVVSAQLMFSDPGTEAWVAPVLLAAARAAMERAAPGSALALLDRALAEPPAPELVAGVREAAAMAAVSLARPDADVRLELALAACNDGAGRARLTRPLSALRLLGGEARAALAMLEDAIAALPEDERDLGLMLELDVWRVGQFDPAARRRVEARRMRFAPAPDDHAHPGWEARDAIESVLTTGVARDAARRAICALAEGELLAAEGSESPIFQMAANALTLAGEFPPARAAYDDAIAQATARGSRRGFMLGHAFRALANRGLGELAAAEADARAYLEDGPPGPVRRVAVAALVTTLIDAGNLSAAASAIRDEPREPGNEASAGHLLQARARLHLEAGDPEAALAQLAILERHEAVWEIATPAMTQWRLYAARAHTALGNDEPARALAGEEVARARAFGAPALLGGALVVAAEVGAAAGRLELLEKAVAVLEDSPAALEHARALVALGVALRRAGRRVDARAPLHQGVELARRCGAATLVAYAYDELEATGSRQRRILRIGVDSLTASEHRIATLAADGASNRRIAQALFLSVRTVETHLGRAYSKLDISSREQLRDALRAEGAR